ncbi:MAG: hypothetical protein D8H92_02860 [Campylobacter sp.]|nr:MAG: hypothetical protein D8H92_02860 [Campylobacter sp.]
MKKFYFTISLARNSARFVQLAKFYFTASSRVNFKILACRSLCPHIALHCCAYNYHYLTPLAAAP